MNNSELRRWSIEEKLNRCADIARRQRELSHRDNFTTEDRDIFLNRLRLMKPQWRSPVGPYRHIAAYSRNLNA